MGFFIIEGIIIITLRNLARWIARLEETPPPATIRHQDESIHGPEKTSPNRLKMRQALQRSKLRTR